MGSEDGQPSPDERRWVSFALYDIDQTCTDKGLIVDAR